MESRQARKYESLESSLALLRLPECQRPDLIPLIEDLQAAIDAVGKLRLEQYIAGSSPGGDGATIRHLRKELRKHLLRIGRLAVVALAGLPGIREDVRVPHANAKNKELEEAATRIMKNIRPHLTTLYARGLPKTTIPEMEKLLKALAAKIADPETQIARRSRATSALPAALSHGREIVDAIDRAIQVEFAGDRGLLQRWAHAKRIPPKLGRPKTKGKPKLPP